MKALSIKNLLFFLLAMVLWFPTPALANSAEPPGFTVIVTHGPEDLTVSLQLEKAGKKEAVVLEKERKAWETYYRFFYHTLQGSREGLKGAVLLAETEQEQISFPFPNETVRTYNTILSLDWETKTLTQGQPFYRTPLLVGMRVVLTLLLEGILFYLFGYRQKRSWVLFFAVNLITQGILNAMITGPRIYSYWIFGLAFGEGIVFVVELLVYISLLREHGKGRGALCALTANLASFILGGTLIAYLPV